MTGPVPNAAYSALGDHGFRASAFTRGPWDPDHQHAGPPVALACRAAERAARQHGLEHMARLTANLLRPVPIGDLVVDVAVDYVGRNAGHFSGRVSAGGKDVIRFTSLVQRVSPLALPENIPGHPLPLAPLPPEASAPASFPFAGKSTGYADLVETRLARGTMWRGPCAVWFRLRHPLLEGEDPGEYQRVAVAADSGNGISAVLDYRHYLFVNSDLTINLLRRPVGEWICLDSRTALGGGGGGLAESALYDTEGLVGRATQSLAVRRRGET
jgi:hypothetical protein